MSNNSFQIVMIPINQIDILNPRQRGQHKFKQIVASIETLGLKKPICVSPRETKEGPQRYYLVYGQGRLEAFKGLGQTEVPAIVVPMDKESIAIRSLIENLARKRYYTIDLAQQLPLLKERGYTIEEIAKKTNLAVDYVRGVLRLLSKGEVNLLRAVEAGQIPITIAITIASSDDAAVQRALAEAYENKSLRGRALLKARKLIEFRRNHGKSGRGMMRSRGKLTADQVAKTLVAEMNKQRDIVRKAKLCETRLTFAIAGLRSLFSDEHFLTLLRAEGLDSLPAFLHEQIYLQHGQHHHAI